MWAASLWFFGEIFLVGLSKLHCPLLENSFWWKKNSDQKIVTSTFSDLWKVFRILGNKLRQACQKIIVHVLTNILRRNNFVWKTHNFFIIFGIRANDFLVFWREVFGRVVTTAFFTYIGTFWGNLFSFLKFHIFIRAFRDLSCKSVDF